MDGSRGHESEKHVPSAATESVTQTERAAVPSGAAFGWGPDGDGQAETGPDGGIPAGGEDREASAGLGVRRLSCVGLPIVGGSQGPVGAVGRASGPCVRSYRARCGRAPGSRVPRAALQSGRSHVTHGQVVSLLLVFCCCFLFFVFF